MKNKPITLQEFETDSLSLSAYLICNACVLKQIKSSPIAGKYLFVFATNAQITKLKTDYFTYEAFVTPQAYYAAIRDVKRLLMEFRNKNERR